MVSVICKCGKEFKVWPKDIRTGRGKYCSRECFVKYRTYTRKGRLTEECLQCKKKFTTWECKKKRGGGNFCSLECFGKFQSEHTTEEKREKTRKRLAKHGPEHPSWKGGRKISSGYIQVWNPEHPFSDKHGYVFEHRLVMEKHIGRYLEHEEVVHHKDHNRQNNNIENLQLCANNAEHKALHEIEKYGGSISKTGWASIWNECKCCKSTKTPHQAKGLCRTCYLRKWKIEHRSDVI